MNEQSSKTNWIFPAVSWILSLYFFVNFHLVAGFPPTNLSSKESWLMLGLSLFLFFAPLAKRIKLGKFFEYEKEIHEIKKDIGQFKDESTRNFSFLMSSVNTISNLSSTVNVNFATKEEIQNAKDALISNSENYSSKEARRIKDELLSDNDDNILSLARTRITMEQLLRNHLKTNYKSKIDDKVITNMSINGMFRQFLKDYPHFESLEGPVRLVVKACNAAIHGQKISQNEADEALNIGSQVIAILQSTIANKNN